MSKSMTRERTKSEQTGFRLRRRSKRRLTGGAAAVTAAVVGWFAYYEGTDRVALKRLRGDLERRLRDGGSAP